MSRLFTSLALGAALLSTSALRGADASDMPVFYGKSATELYPMFAQKDGNFYPVLVRAGTPPFFRVSSTEWHYLETDQVQDTLLSSNASPSAAGYPVYYVTNEATAPIALPRGMSNEQKDSLLAGDASANDHLVCWGRRWGWHRYHYQYFPRYTYYPAYRCYPRVQSVGFYYSAYGNASAYRGYGYVYRGYTGPDYSNAQYQIPNDQYSQPYRSFPSPGAVTPVAPVQTPIAPVQTPAGNSNQLAIQRLREKLASREVQENARLREALEQQLQQLESPTQR